MNAKNWISKRVKKLALATEAKVRLRKTSLNNTLRLVRDLPEFKCDRLCYWHIITVNYESTDSA